MKLVYLKSDMLIPDNIHAGVRPSIYGMFVDGAHNWRLSVSSATRTLRAGERAQTTEIDRPRYAERENDEAAM